MTGMKYMPLRAFSKMVSEVLETLPDFFHPYMRNLVVDIEDAPDERTLRDQGFTDVDIDEGATLYGLFIPFAIAGEVEFGGIDEHDQPMHRIVIYKQPLEEDYPDARELRREVRKTVIHELAHHFGYSERDLEPFENRDDPFGDE